MIRSPKYSVIIPVYNAEATLHRCVDSLLNQNYPDAEIILVNDGSKDSSGRICKEYSEKYPGVVYIDKINGGVSTARNAGLNAATGKYVLFVDSDDYVARDYFAVLDEKDPEDKYDCLFFSHIVEDGNNITHKVLKPFSAQSEEESVSKFCEALYLKYLTHPINKRYLRRIIEEEKIRFPEHLYVGEDKTFSLKYVLSCKSCLILSDTLYYVNVDNKNSLSRKPRPDLYQQLELLSAQTQRTLLTANIPEEYRRQYIAAENLIQLRGVYSEAKRMHLAGIDRKNRHGKIRQMCISSNSLKADLPTGLFSKLLQIPVRLKLVTVIDLMGAYLSR